MNKRETFALSSLTIGVSAAALLGVSDLSSAGDNPEFCAVSETCYLGYYPHLLDLQVFGLGGLPYQYHSQVYSYVEGLYMAYSGGTELYGGCVMHNPPGYPPEETFCACAGESPPQVDIKVYITTDPLGMIPQITPIEGSSIVNIHDSQCWYP